MENKKHTPDYEISTYNKRTPQEIDLMGLECDNKSQNDKGGANEYNSSSNQQR